MSRKNDILTNLREYSSDQIVEAINEGVVTMYELSKSGNLTPLMRKHIEEKLTGGSTVTIDGTHTDNVAPSVVEEKTVDNSSKSQDEEEKFVKPTIPEAEILEDSKVVIAPIAADIVNSEADDGQEQPIYDEEPSNKGMFKRPFSFHGRIRRLEYGLSILLFYLYAVVAGFFLGLITNGEVSENAIYACLIPGYWFLWAQGAKRCHDRGNSGWFQIIPFYGFWMLFADGDEGENDYGDNPKGK